MVCEEPIALEGLIQLESQQNELVRVPDYEFVLFPSFNLYEVPRILKVQTVLQLVRKIGYCIQLALPPLSTDLLRAVVLACWCLKHLTLL